MSYELREDFGQAKQRLQEIAEAVDDDEMPLDKVLDLFEEAVSLGMQISDLLEVGQDAPEGMPSAADNADAVDSANAAAADTADASAPAQPQDQAQPQAR